MQGMSVIAPEFRRRHHGGQWGLLDIVRQQQCVKRIYSAHRRTGKLSDRLYL